MIAICWVHWSGVALREVDAEHFSDVAIGDRRWKQIECA
jgi:hypothetical protein